jgi:hypothetical protein
MEGLAHHMLAVCALDALPATFVLVRVTENKETKPTWSMVPGFSCRTVRRETNCLMVQRLCVTLITAFPRRRLMPFCGFLSEGSLSICLLASPFLVVIYSVHDVKGIVGPLSKLCPFAICYFLLISRFVECWRMKERKEYGSHIDLMNR